MYLQALWKDALEKLKGDVEANIGKYCTGENWVEKYFEDKEIKIPFYQTEIEFPDDFELISEAGADNDRENAIRLHSVLRGKITPVQAADDRLWVSLTHHKFYYYMQKRWVVKERAKPNGTIVDRYFSHRGLLRNGISRLYWLAAITYDEKQKDPYLYTGYLMNRQELINQVEGSSLCRNRSFLRTALKVLMKEENLSDVQIKQYFKRINQKGGVILLDALSEQRMEELCAQTIETVLAEKNNTQLELESVNGGRSLETQTHGGHAYVGKTKFLNHLDNIYER